MRGKEMTMTRKWIVGIAVLLLASSAYAGGLDPQLDWAAEHATKANHAKHARTGMATLKTVGGQLYASVILEAAPSALQPLQAMGVQLHTVLSTGIVTADVPVNKLRAVAARADVGQVQAGKRVRLFNDLSNDLIGYGGDVQAGMNNPGTHDGSGVCIGIIDSGLDWTHGDFVDDATGLSRIEFYWDQSDVADTAPPGGYTYGTEYQAADFDYALAGWDHTWDSATNAWAAIDDPSYPIAAAARDYDGHGTHVTGTVGGDGSASGYVGAAPSAKIIFVKFDFEGDRNTDAAIVDGVAYIFQKAAQLGCAAVINMSLGSDMGPHDGSTLEERGISDLTGPGKVVVVAAGNPGANNWSDALAWGYALHGDGDMAADPIVFRFPANVAAGDYVFFDIWYDGGDETRVRVTTPGGQTYPPSETGKNRNTWKTGSKTTGYSTAEGGIIVGNGGDQFGWDTNNGDHEIYVEISDYWGTVPTAGEWTIEIVPLSAPTGTYHAWYGVSSNLVHGYRAEPTPRSPTPTFGGQQSDNAVTIGSPASADKVIAAAAYATRLEWDYYDGTTDTTGYGQRYDAPPIGYYDAFGLGELAYFSGRGPRRDGVLKPEIATPGVGIASSFSHFTRWLEWPDRAVAYDAGGPYHFATNRVTPNLEGGILQGTSMACPNATGAIALLLQADPSLDDAALRALFATTARHDAITDVYENAPFTAGTDTDSSAAAGQPNNDWGYGRLDIAASLSALTCLSDAACDDQNPCTDDTCDLGSGSCSNAPNSAACDDGDACTSADVCSAGSCSGTQTDCDDGDACTIDACDAGSGLCSHEPDPACGGTCASNKEYCATNADCCSGVCKRNACKGN